MRASNFLNSVTSFAGLTEHFDHPDLTLYYTLTRKRVSAFSTVDVDAFKGRFALYGIVVVDFSNIEVD
jgi:hypothetical protein